MNEVTVLTRAGEITGAAVGHGVRLARRAAVAVGRGGAAAGVSAARTAGRSTDHVRRELAATIAPRRRRRWPWVLLGVGLAGAGTVAVVLRRPVAPSPALAPPRVEDLQEPARGAPAP